MEFLRFTNGLTRNEREVFIDADQVRAISGTDDANKVTEIYQQGSDVPIFVKELPGDVARRVAQARSK